MSPPGGGRPQLPNELRDRLFEVLFGAPAARDEQVALLVAEHADHAESLRELWQQHLAMEGLTSADAAHEQIAPGYRLLSVLGEGGMGTVYRAEELGPLRRQVALKVIKPGMDSRQVVARFELERQSLAAMDHAAIAKVFGCGTTTRGQPFFAMELVPGLPLQRYCDQRRMPLRERLRLFQQVCDGVQHAHQKGVIHRDLKPGNILVADRDGEPAVKIIDFGVARATDPSQAGGTLFTEQGVVIGTPEYMSPEQARGDLARIDTRTDVYSLGVVLYELLVGALPFPADSLRAAGQQEILRRLCEDEPPTPSRRLTGLGAAATTCAEQRAIDRESLRRELARDLDWVVLRAMAKEPERRYASAQALAEDLGRYLAHQPLQAGPPTAIYQLRKLLRRHRGPFAAAAAVLATAVVGAVLTVQFALREQQKVREFDLMIGDVQIQQLLADLPSTYPARESKIPAMEHWLQQLAELQAMQAPMAAVLQGLREQALPQTAADREHDRATHPLQARVQWLEQQLAVQQRAMDVRDDPASLQRPTLSPLQQALPVRDLSRKAWERVAPDQAARKVFGEEPLGLVLAEAAVAKARGTQEEAQSLSVLSWACFATGLDGEARTHTAAAVAAASKDSLRAHYTARSQALADAQANAAAAMAQTATELQQLRARVQERRTWRFAQPGLKVLHDQLAALQVTMSDLDANVRPGVASRLQHARCIRSLSLDHPHARLSWQQARAAVAASERYRGLSLPLADDDVLGLVPIGVNPITRLFECYDLDSAWDGVQDPATLPIPELRPDGSIEVTDATGIVFVLVPGGNFMMGAQQDPNGPNFYDKALLDETPHEVTLQPFLIARHELTQGQWARMWTWDESQRRPSYRPTGTLIGSELIADTHPVEFVNWSMCDTLLRRHGLLLPTEAQWEYACRAGTRSPWCCGSDALDLLRFANIADATFKQGSPNQPAVPWDDGFEAHAPVGSFRPNGFGLYDCHGNVWEWCRDCYGSYADGNRPGDGLSMTRENLSRAHRGAGYGNGPGNVRSSARGQSSETFRGPGVGLRAARALHP